MAAGKRVVVGLSGGVDSSVTAALLVEAGYEVIGVFMRNWDEKDPECPAAKDALDARVVATKLGIPFYVWDFSKAYWEEVFADFLRQHTLGRTPNPDVLCNKHIKFKHFLKAAEALEADFIATGHYAAKKEDKENHLAFLACPKDKHKDQTYFLYTITQEALQKTLFPLANLEKKEVREMAKKFGFHNAQKRDSVGICFIGERPYIEFLKQYLPERPGVIKTEKGEEIGTHCGVMFYTLGQRRHLNIGGVKGYAEAPWFVIEKRMEENVLIVSQDGNHPKLFARRLQTNNWHWISGPPAKLTSQVFYAKTRYRQDFQPCRVTAEKASGLEITFEAPQRAITPGQSVVLYDAQKSICLGGGEIDLVVKS